VSYVDRDRVGNNGPSGQGELAAPATLLGTFLPAGPPGEGSDGPGVCWESAWIDLGGEG